MLRLRWGGVVKGAKWERRGVKKERKGRQAHGDDDEVD